MEIFENLLRDHERLKRMIARLKSEAEEVDQKMAVFNELKELLAAHTAAEETVVLSRSLKDPLARARTLEGLEEHVLAEDLVNKIGHTNELEVWEARVKVLCDSLEHHLKEEEEDLFPDLKNRWTRAERERMGEEYENVRDQNHERGIVTETWMAHF